MRISSGASIRRGEVDDRHVGDDAVVVGRIALRDGQRFASALRAADVVVEARTFAIDALHDDHRGVVRLLHLHVAEVVDGLVVERPVVATAGSAARRATTRGAPPASRTRRTRRSAGRGGHRPGRDRRAGTTRASGRRPARPHRGLPAPAPPAARSTRRRTAGAAGSRRPPAPGAPARTPRAARSAATRRSTAKAAGLMARVTAVGRKAAADISAGRLQEWCRSCHRRPAAIRAAPTWQAALRGS